MYLNKCPDQLSDMDIIRGLRISGVVKGYTTFDTKLMNQVVDDYSIDCVYDPCAGWGERLLLCAYKNIHYFGADINTSLADGYSRMCEDYKTTRQSVYIGNGADMSFLDVSSYNNCAVITCPPYFNTEIYSNQGSENYSYEAFLDWWRTIVENAFESGIRLFCFQINQKYKSDMQSIVESVGYVFDKEYNFKNNRVSHFNRRNGVILKKEYESMLVFRV